LQGVKSPTNLMIPTFGGKEKSTSKYIFMNFLGGKKKKVQVLRRYFNCRKKGKRGGGDELGVGSSKKVLL